MDYLKIEPFTQWDEATYSYCGKKYEFRAKWLYFMHLRTKEKQWMNTISNKELLVINIPAFCLN